MVLAEKDTLLGRNFSIKSIGTCHGFESFRLYEMDSGKAAIIIGGHTRWDDKGRIQAGKQRIFFNYLYSRYNVADVINIDGAQTFLKARNFI